MTDYGPVVVCYYFQIMIDLSLQDKLVCEGQPCIKNAHLATHLRLLNNSYLCLCIDQTLQIYSLPQIAENRAALVRVLPLNQIYVQKEHYEDFLTRIFRNAEKEDFSAQIFSRSQDLSSSALLKVEYIRDRIAFFCNSRLQVRKLQIINGKVLLLLKDGRAAVLKPQQKWPSSPITAIHLNELSKERIRGACLIGEDSVCMLVGDKLLLHDLNERTKLIGHKLGVKTTAYDLYGASIEKEKVRIWVVGDREISVLEFGKKKLISSKVVQTDSCTGQAFFYGSHLFVTTQTSLFKIEATSTGLTKTTMTVFPKPSDLIMVDENGSWSARTHSSDREAVWLCDSTSNGVVVALTIRRNGNYKEGRLLVFQPQLQSYLRNLLLNVRRGRSLDLADSILLPRNKEIRQQLSDFANLRHTGNLEYASLKLTSEEYDIAAINVGHAFEGKQLVKQRIIERLLKQRFDKLGLNASSMDYTTLTSRCCITGKDLSDQPLSHCPPCDIFTVRFSITQICPVCRRTLQPYE